MEVYTLDSKTVMQLKLAEEILEDFELQKIPAQNILLKCLRLARLINDLDAIEWLYQEANGFEMDEQNKLTKKAWEATKKSGRRIFETNKNGEKQELAFIQTLATLEKTIEINMKRMESAKDPNISVSTQSPYNPVLPQNKFERMGIVENIASLTTKFEKIRANIYKYVLNVYYQLRFGNVVEEIFTEQRLFVDKVLSQFAPDTVKKLITIYENLQKRSEENWSNAVHSCRRILNEISDILYPPCKEPFQKEINGKMKEIKRGKDNYINRLILFVEDNSDSETFHRVVGSNLKFICDRIESIYKASCKGTHSIVTFEEAKKYIIYTYLLLGDILSLKITNH